MERFPEKVAVAVFVTATMPAAGKPMSFAYKQLSQGKGPDLYMDCTMGSTGDPQNPDKTFLFGPKYMTRRVYQLSPPEDLTLAVAMVRPSRRFLNDETMNGVVLTAERYGALRRVYIVAEDDELKPAEMQRRMASWNPGTEVIGLQGADHMPMFSKPRELSELFMEIANKSNRVEDLRTKQKSPAYRSCWSACADQQSRGCSNLRTNIWWHHGHASSKRSTMPLTQVVEASPDGSQDDDASPPPPPPSRPTNRQRPFFTGTAYLRCTDTLDCSICFLPVQGGAHGVLAVPLQAAAGGVGQVPRVPHPNRVRGAVPRHGDDCGVGPRPVPARRARLRTQAGVPRWGTRHARECPHAPLLRCPGGAAGCGFAGRTAALAGHVAGVHGWPCTAEASAGDYFGVGLRDGFNFLLTAARGGNAQHLLLLNMATTARSGAPSPQSGYYILRASFIITLTSGREELQLSSLLIFLFTTCCIIYFPFSL